MSFFGSSADPPGCDSSSAASPSCSWCRPGRPNMEIQIEQGDHVVQERPKLTLNMSSWHVSAQMSRQAIRAATKVRASLKRSNAQGSDWYPYYAGYSAELVREALDRLALPGRCCTNRQGPARCQSTGSSPANAIRHWSAEGGHPIEDLTAEDDLTPLSSWTPGAKAIADDGRVSEERILHPALTMIP